MNAAPSSTPSFDPELIDRLLAPLRGQRALIALDVDGTLVDHDSVMSSAVHTAVNAVREAGHHVVIATGRSIGSTVPIVRMAGVGDGWCVSSNGAVTARVAGSADSDVRVVNTVTFNPLPALSSMYARLPNAYFAVELPTGEFLANRGFDDVSFGLEARQVGIEDLLACPEVVRVVVTSPLMPTKEFAQHVAEAGVEGCEYAIGWSSWMDISAPGVTKAVALERLRETLGVAPEHTVAIGDGANDVQMLRWAAAGFAMGQANETVVGAADAITRDIDHDGAAHVLRALLVD